MNTVIKDFYCLQTDSVEEVCTPLVWDYDIDICDFETEVNNTNNYMKIYTEIKFYVVFCKYRGNMTLNVYYLIETLRAIV